MLKLGGELLEQPERLRDIATAVATMAAHQPLVVVHGGGREVDAELERLGITRRAVDGLRITDDATLEVVVAILAGRVNTRLVAAVAAAGAAAVGLTGADASIGLAEPAAPYRTADGRSVDLGLVGRPVEAAPPPLLTELCRSGYVPVVASIGATRDGRLLNVNADAMAAQLAINLAATRLVMAGTTPGVIDDAGRPIARLDAAAIEHLVAGGKASAGMVAKLDACRAARRGGVEEVRIVDGRTLTTLETNGTIIDTDADDARPPLLQEPRS